MKISDETIAEVKQFENGHVPEDAAEEQPEFDFSRISWGLTKKLQRVQVAFGRINEIPKEDVRSADLKESLDLTDELMAFVSMTVISIPRGWLMDDAPDGLDWRDVESLDWLQASCVPSLIRAFNDANIDSQKK